MPNAPELPTPPAPAIPLSEWRSALVDRVRPGGLSPREQAACPLGGQRYKLLHKLGEGGMGEIWCAEQVGLRRRVALKFLKRHLEDDPTARRRFVREGRIAALAAHPGVVDVFDIVQQEGERPFLVMQLLEGRTLAELIRPGSPFEPRRAVRLLKVLAEALAHVHSKGILHRDVKPANIMLVGGAMDAETCKLIDFGLADSPERSMSVTRAGELMGSPAYMSPEQFRGEAVDARSDVYALGCVAYFMLSGVRPFQGRTPAEVMYQHLSARLPALPPLQTSVAMEQRLQSVLKTACHKKPARRFSSAREFAGALADAAETPCPRVRSERGGAKSWASLGLLRAVATFG